MANFAVFPPHRLASVSVAASNLLETEEVVCSTNFCHSQQTNCTVMLTYFTLCLLGYRFTAHWIKITEPVEGFHLQDFVSNFWCLTVFFSHGNLVTSVFIWKLLTYIYFCISNTTINLFLGITIIFLL